MATAAFSDQEPDRLRLPGRPILVRLFSYVRPYLALIALTLVLSLGYSSARYLRAYLVKPLLDDVALPGVVYQQHARGSWLPSLGFGPAEGEGGAAESRGPLAAGAPDPSLERRIWDHLAQLVAVAIGLVFAMPLLLFARSYLVEYALGRIQIDIQRDVCAKLLALPLRFHQDRRRGDVLARTLQDVAAAHGGLSLVFSDLLQMLMSLLVGAGFLVAISWQLSLLGLLAGPLVFGVTSLFGRRIRRSARMRQERIADVTHRLVEILGGIKVIKAFRAEALEEVSFRRETRRLFRRSMRVARNRVAARSLVEMLNFAIGVAVIVGGALVVRRGWWGLTTGDLAAFAAVLGTAYQPVKGLARGWVSLMDAEPAAERFFEVLDAPVEIRDAPRAVSIDGVREAVRFESVAFSYGREPVLRDVSLEVKAGEVVAIVGRTGAGKTTLVDLLLRFHDPTLGRITIDGVDLRQIARDSLLRQIAVVTQDPFLFDGTIRENLRYGRPAASESEVLAAARAAHVDEFADQLPQGYDTPVGEDGVRLSGGQRQRITIARALLRDPAILIFDEATSSLDSKSERTVQDATLALLSGPRTVFAIAHRLSTVRRADRIVVLEQGRITQVGRHAELIARPGLYRDLVELQGAAGAWHSTEA